MSISKSKFKKNLAFAFMAQSISFLLSAIMSIIVPKFLNVENYGYWQLFLFYVSYAGFFHFGLTDGVYLKIGGTKYEDLDAEDINNQFHALLYIQIFVSLIILLLSLLFVNGTKSNILIISSFYILIANMNWFLGFVFQAANETKIYSISVMIDRILFIFAVCGTFIFRINSFYLLMAFYTLTRLIALLYCIYVGRNLLKFRTHNFIKSLSNTKEYIGIGINIMLGSIASMLIIGIGRFFVEHKWGIVEFGKFSFSISITNFFLLFIQQISMVLFPTLRQLDDSHGRTKIYVMCRRVLCILLPIIFIGYIPCKIFLTWWLPQYTISLKYLSLLLPLCIFDGKMQMLSNTYLKVLRKEKVLLRLNVFVLMISILVSILGTYIFDNTYVIIIGLVVVIALRSTIAEIYLAKIMKLSLNKERIFIVMELLFSTVFIISNFLLASGFAFFINVICYILYCYILKEDFKYTIDIINNKVFKKVKNA